MTIKKYEENGEIAVLVSTMYEKDWSFYPGTRDVLFDPVLVKLILDGKTESKEFNEHVSLLREKSFPVYNYLPASRIQKTARNLLVKWVCKGDKFKIDEYDGMENLVLLDEEDYIVA